MTGLPIPPSSPLRPWWLPPLWFLGRLIYFASCLLVVSLLLQYLGEMLLGDRLRTNLHYLYLDWTAQLIGALLALAIFNQSVSRVSWIELGFPRSGLGERWLSGALVGGILMLVIFLILWLGGWLVVLEGRWRGGPFFAWLGFFLIQPLCEEVIMRGFLQQQLHRLFGAWTGLWGTALVFALLHAFNDHFSYLAAANILAGGLLMGLLYLRTQSVWGAYGLHAAWNFFQSTVLGFAVSGFEAYSVLDLELSGPDWWTGGAFGAEGSAPALACLTVAIVYFWPASRLDLPTAAHAKTIPNATDHESHSA